MKLHIQSIMILYFIRFTQKITQTRKNIKILKVKC